MTYADINKRYTEIVAEYISKGYAINTATMSGSQGAIAKIDLTNSTEIIRIMIDTFSDWMNSLEGTEIIVGKVTDEDVRPHSNSGWAIIWNNRLEILSTERFYKIGEDRRHGTFYGSEVEAKAVVAIRRSRNFLRESTCQTENISEKAMEIAKRIIRREFGVKRICEADIKISKYNSTYTIGYKGKTYRLH